MVKNNKLLDTAYAGSYEYDSGEYTIRAFIKSPSDVRAIDLLLSAKLTKQALIIVTKQSSHNYKTKKVTKTKK
jgi:outer membrane protease